MTALAGLLAADGCRVTGSDKALYPPTSTILGRLGLELSEGFDGKNLKPTPDLVVVGNAVSRGNPEVEAMLDRDLEYTSMARLIHEVVEHDSGHIEKDRLAYENTVSQDDPHADHANGIQGEDAVREGGASDEAYETEDHGDEEYDFGDESDLFAHATSYLSTSMTRRSSCALRSRFSCSGSSTYMV